MNQEQLREKFEENIFFEHFIKSIERDDTKPMPLGINPEKSLTKAELCERDADGNYVRQDVCAMWFAWALAYKTFAKYESSMGAAAQDYMDSVAVNGASRLPAQFRWADCFAHMLKADEPHEFVVGDFVRFERLGQLGYGRVTEVEAQAVTAVMFWLKATDVQSAVPVRITYLLNLHKTNEGEWDAAKRMLPELANC